VVSFTGSSEVGGLLSASATASVKRLTLELGGNAPFIVFRYYTSHNWAGIKLLQNFAQFRELPASIKTKNL
jgi:acyl-CoA reductase-like NAD-dependent aldehyde dehydrogenase